VIDDKSLDRRLCRVLQDGQVNSVIDELLARRVPMHLGGMSDPLSSLETRSGATLRVLQILSYHDYPTVISTKSELFAAPEYLSLLTSGCFVLQCSLSSMDDRLLTDVDCGTPGPTRLVKAARKAAREGVPVSFRVQPLLPTREKDAYDVLVVAADVGAFHVAFEHLKLPLEESWVGTHKLSSILGLDLRDFYRKNRASRVGREWVLPPEQRLPGLLQLRDAAHELGLSFGAADTDLLPIGDGSCCCSGLDLLDSWSGFHFRHNFAEAIRRASPDGVVTYSSIEECWLPSRSISRWVNSRSRLPFDTDQGSGASMQAYLLRNWEGSPNGPMPEGFYGVSSAGSRDPEGRMTYQVSADVLELIFEARRTNSGAPKGLESTRY
jgi:hypothetical protein